MFRMEFQSLDAVEEDEDRSRSYRNEGTRGTSVYEQYRQGAVDRRDSPPKVYEGRVGKFGKMQRVVSSNHAVHTISHLPPVTITRTRSLSSDNSIPKNWVEVDLIDFSDPPKAATEVASAGEQEVIRELVKPFAESVKLTPHENGTVTVPEHQPVQDFLSNGVEEVSGSSPNTASLQVRSDSIRSTNSTSRSESSDAESSNGERVHPKDEEKGGSPSTTRSVNKAFNKFMHKKNKPTVPEAKFVKPWEEPLLLTHEQVKAERKLENEAKLEAKLEAKRQAEEAKREAEIQQRELLELANPVPESSLRNQKEHGVLKGSNGKVGQVMKNNRSSGPPSPLTRLVHKLFHMHGGAIHSNSPSPREVVCHADVRESKLVMPRSGMFEAPVMSPASTDVALAQIRSGPRPLAKTDLTFATVESNQRDVQPWTMEEYMAKNARLGDWEKRVDDEEFGGIEGNQLLNQYLNDDTFNNFDSSDSD